MSELKAFLKKTDKLLGTPSEADVNAVKDTLEALRKVAPDLVDSKIFERLSRLVDSVQIAQNTQKQVNLLALNVKNLEIKTRKLTETLQFMKNSFDGLERRLTFDANSQAHRNKKFVETLELLNQYLRRHT